MTDPFGRDTNTRYEVVWRRHDGFKLWFAGWFTSLVDAQTKADELMANEFVGARALVIRGSDRQTVYRAQGHNVPPVWQHRQSEADNGTA